MCWVVYAAADRPLPMIPWDATAPAFNVMPLRETEEAVRVQFAAPHVVSPGSHTGCGCGFDPGQANPAQPDESRDTMASLEALGAWLREATADGPVELYACWDGDQAASPDQRLELTADAIHPAMQWFPERTYAIVRPAID